MPRASRAFVEAFDTVNAPPDRPRAAGCAILLAASLLAGCGDGTATSMIGTTSRTSGPITKTQTVEYAHAVNLQPRDMAGFASIRARTIRPRNQPLPRWRQPRPPHRRHPVNRIVRWKRLFGKLFKSIVEVWPTPALVALNNTTSHSSRAERASCASWRRSINGSIRNAKGERQSGRSRSPLCPTHCPA